MDLKALRVFIEVSRTGSLRQAAQLLGMSPAAVARKLDHLEYHFRTPLLDRSPSGMALTEAGELLAARARLTLGDMDTTRQLIDDLRGLRRGSVCIYAGGALVSELLVPILTEIHDRYPGLRFRVSEGRTKELFEALRHGEADLGVAIFSPASARPYVQASTSLEHAAIVGADHPLATMRGVTLRDVVRHPLAVPDASYSVRQEVERVARSNGLSIDPVFVTGSLIVQKELALRGRAVLILPPECFRREIEAGSLRSVPLLGEDRIGTSLDVCRHPDRALTYAARALNTALLEHMRRREKGVGGPDACWQTMGVSDPTGGGGTDMAGLRYRA
ncbi:LysR family transcriptional regulator [Gluconacetobacter tumulicola]|uniref:LysR family transcriptional regulator n=1 Tax=Gluconacetobacter tumulicola TaxID=1017177 RepID=A0A7W4JAP9_9PROT|nr:LysR family transcriptional regulator [Gluconacetobacter tumulicola]MBB2177804.1 LysR family transcriptional regulator [Gluconacetobacter tumulicola]